MSNFTKMETHKMGTPLYISPEIEKHDPHSNSKIEYTNKVDIYALGIILLELLTNFFTFHEKKLKINELVNKEMVPVELTQGTYKHFGNLLIKMTNSSPTNRPTTAEIIEDQDYKALVGLKFDK